MKYTIFSEKAKAHKKPLHHKTVVPVSYVHFEEDKLAFQKVRAVKDAKCNLPILLNAGDSVTLDFGEHCVGCLHYTVNHTYTITDSPLRLKFTFGEMPLELTVPSDEYHGTLGDGWLQNEVKTSVFLPCAVQLERRYAFRYVRIERIDNATKFPVEIQQLYCDCVSSVSRESAAEFAISDPFLKRIYDISLDTLCSCEQDVFEDGPKRDRRLWIGDLRLQALTDYVSFKNIDLIKRCIYLFASYRIDGAVAPYVFPDSPPYVDGWVFDDYSLFFISCIYDYMENCGDLELPAELYDIALQQAQIVGAKIETMKVTPFIDWCDGLDKSVAIIGVYIYTLRQLYAIAKKLQKDATWIKAEIDKAEMALRGFYSEKEGLFVTESNQISWHSQVWAVLSGVLTKDENVKVLENIETSKTAFTMRTPYMMHYYLEALYSCNLKKKALDFLKGYWGKIVACGFDRCPEIFNPENQFESPYNAPEINSACHAWSCTPVYWLHMLDAENTDKE